MAFIVDNIESEGYITGATVSATTLYGSGVNLSGVAKSTTTGGTYSNGTTVFTNSTGGTFNVTGYYTGATDVFVTGGTYSDGSTIFTNNTGGTFTVTGFSTGTTFNGGTVTGLTATTISATTYQNLPVTFDRVVTGGTYSNGTAVFTNNSGQTFNVTGFKTNDIVVTGGTGNNATKIYTFTNNTGGTFNVNALTDLTITGGTYSNGTTTFTNSTGGTFNVTGFTTPFTGGTVTGPTNFTGGITANTITATTYFNLPTDIRVTGGTYSSGTAVFTNNTGGTFNVTGFSTGGGSFTGGTVTGPTIFTGGLTANTFVKSGGTSAQYLMADGSTFSGTSYGFYALRDANSITTTNATPTLLGVISGLTTGTHIIESYVTANKSNVEYGVWKRTLGVTTTGNTPVIVHENADVDKVFSGFTGNTIVYTPTANNTIEIYVTGIVGNTYNWKSYSEIVDDGIATSCFTTITSNISATTITSNSISATTISATTYLNLPAASFSGGTVTGPTNFTNGLTATTISATTYLNLPASGGSFTGGTVTGATNFTNGLTASTISATTYQGVGGNFGITVDGSGSVLTTGIKGYLVIPYNATITGWDIIGNSVGSCVFDVWKSASPTIPTVANTITGTEKPTLSSQQINSDNNLTTWSKELLTNDIICFNIDSASVISRVTLTIKLIKK